MGGKWNRDTGTGRVLITTTDKDALVSWYGMVKNLGLPIEKVDSDWYLYDARDFDIQSSTNVLTGLDNFIGRVIFAPLPDFSPGEFMVEEDQEEDVVLQAANDEGKDVQPPRNGKKAWITFFNR